MSHDYTFISDLNNSGQMPMQQVPMQQVPMQQVPMQSNMLRKYLAEESDDDESDSEYDDNDQESHSWQHYYGIANLILLAVILYYIYKIRKELTGMYEEV